MSASNLSLTTFARMSTNTNFDPNGVLKKNLEFKKLIEKGDFDGASKFFSDTDFISGAKTDYFEAIVRSKVAELPSCPEEEKKRILLQVVAVIKFFEKNGVDASYNRLCCAAAYLSLGEQTLLDQRLPGICQSRGKDQQSDFYTLNQMRYSDSTDKVLFDIFFRPLQEVVTRYASRMATSFTLAYLSQKA